jgi:hypothetical protein
MMSESIAHPVNGDPIYFRTFTGVGGPVKGTREGAMITWGEKLCLVWNTEEPHRGLDVVDSKDVYTTYEEARAAEATEYQEYMRNQKQLRQLQLKKRGE